MSHVHNFTVQKGKTFSRVLRWETEPLIYVSISDIQAEAPVRITAPGHGLTTGWRTAIVGVQGMTEINARFSPPRASDFHKVTVVNPSNIELNEVNASGFSPYTGGGYLQYYTPVSLAGYVARMHIRSSINADTTLLELTTTNGRITLDDTAKTITLLISATDTDAITWTRGVYDLELESPAGVVTQLLSGSVVAQEEVTR